MGAELLDRQLQNEKRQSKLLDQHESQLARLAAFLVRHDGAGGI